jgi:hypothetical protein
VWRGGMTRCCFSIDAYSISQAPSYPHSSRPSALYHTVHWEIRQHKWVGMAHRTKTTSSSPASLLYSGNVLIVAPLSCLLRPLTRR